MDAYCSIGQIIKRLRKYMNITQKELCTDICTQAEISRIENGKNTPYAYTLYRIAERLGVDANYFFDHANTPRLDYIQDTFADIRSLVHENRYDEVEKIVKQELKNPLFRPNVYQQFLLWHKGMIEYYVYNQLEKAKIQLEQALVAYQQTIGYTETQIEILITLGNIHGEVKEYNKAIEIYNLCLNYLQRISRITNPTLKTRILYNLALTLSKGRKDDLAIERCIEGIYLCKKDKSLYLLGELYYQLGYSLWKNYQFNEAIKELDNAVYIFRFLDKQAYLEHTNRIIEEIRLTS